MSAGQVSLFIRRAVQLMIDAYNIFSNQHVMHLAGHIGGFFAGFCGGMIVLSSNIKSNSDKNMYVGYGMILALLVVVFACTAIYEKNAPDYLADACQFYNDIHVENYDCMCGF